MQRNYVCDMVRCKCWDSIENGNEDITVEEINRKCQVCKHSRLSVLKDVCNFEERE